MEKIKNAIVSLYRSETVQAITALFGSNFLVTIIAAIGAFIQGRFVTPEDLGLFKQFGIISGYLFVLHLGVFHAVERLYPYYMGKDERDKAFNVVQIGGSWIQMACIPLALGFIIASIVFLNRGDWKAGLGLLAQAFMIVQSLYGGFLAATYRSGQDFKQLAKGSMVGPLISVTVWPIFWVQSYWALFLKNITGIFTLWILHRNRPVRYQWRFQFSEWLALVKQGLPRFTASYVLNVGAEAVRATVVLQKLGTSGLGYWSFAWMLILMAMQLPQAINAVFVPKIIGLWGSTNSIDKCITLCRKPMLSGLVAMTIIIPVGILGSVYFIPVLLPNYLESVGIIVVLLFILPLMLIEALVSVLNAMNWIGWINICAVSDMAIEIAVMLWGFSLGWGLYSVAVGVLTGRFARAILILLGLFYAHRIQTTESN